MCLLQTFVRDVLCRSFPAQNTSIAQLINLMLLLFLYRLLCICIRITRRKCSFVTNGMESQNKISEKHGLLRSAQRTDLHSTSDHNPTATRYRRFAIILVVLLSFQVWLWQWPIAKTSELDENEAAKPFRWEDVNMQVINF